MKLNAGQYSANITKIGNDLSWCDIVWTPNNIVSKSIKLKSNQDLYDLLHILNSIKRDIENGKAN